MKSQRKEPPKPGERSARLPPWLHTALLFSLAETLMPLAGLVIGYAASLLISNVRVCFGRRLPLLIKTFAFSAKIGYAFKAQSEEERKEPLMLDLSTFAYNSEAPFELTALSERVKDDERIQDISFKSPLRGKVSAYLIGPPEPLPRAGLIFGHWGEGDRGEFVDEAVVLARLGFVSLCLDASFRRPVEYEPEEALPQADLQWIVDVRRAIDILQDRFELIPEHIGYVGHSFGASFGGVIAGVEHRIKAYVFMAGAASATEIMRTSNHPLLVRARENTPPEAWEAMLIAEAPYDACHYIGRAAPSPLFFQFARHDDFVSVQDAEHYFELASKPKQIAWYDNCNHELGVQARIDRAIFLCEQLGLPCPSQHILELLERVPPPVPIGY
jgi:dienelactone hydrolase